MQGLNCEKLTGGGKQLAPSPSQLGDLGEHCKLPEWVWAGRLFLHFGRAVLPVQLELNFYYRMNWSSCHPGVWYPR